jgi:hypothetical protein
MTVQETPIFDIILRHIDDRRSSRCFHLALGPPTPPPTQTHLTLLHTTC